MGEQWKLRSLSQTYVTAKQNESVPGFDIFKPGLYYVFLTFAKFASSKFSKQL